MSLFISIEGGDGAGKSTQADLLMTRLKASGIDALLVHEPGGTDFG
ncbi:MAG: dTMP kinase, partial [Chloroflexi bacterium]|nr:dTMP kinase [Chloroflexota bacterium]